MKTMSKSIEEIELLRNQLLAELQNKIQIQIKKIKCLEYELQRCSLWKESFHQGELLKAHYGLLKKGLEIISVFDWETNEQVQIVLNPKKSPQEQISAIFKSAKKMEVGLIQVIALLEQAKHKLGLLEKQKCQIEQAEDLSPFKPKKTFPIPKNFPEKALPYKEFTSKTGIKIWVGKNAKDNDKLTFVHANGSDWWLHVQDFPGAHVVIKSNNPDSDTFQEAMLLALKYSKAKARGEAEICITQKKYVSRLPRHPGKVQISKHQTKRVKAER